jgi:hypothetical protein
MGTLFFSNESYTIIPAYDEDDDRDNSNTNIMKRSSASSNMYRIFKEKTDESIFQIFGKYYLLI